MKGNDKISFTAEAVAFMRAKENSDKFSKYFVSSKIQRRFNFFKWIIPSNYLDRLFQKRIALSNDLNKLVKEYNPEQIIEFACGYSPRGLLMTQNNPRLVYLETDFSIVINRKKNILKEIESKEKITLSKNHHLLKLDVLNSGSSHLLKKYLNKNKRTLIIAETLTSYLNPEEHEFFIQNINKLLKNFTHSAYLSHEGFSMVPGFFGKLLLFYRDKVAKTKSYKHFGSSEEIKNFFTASLNASKVKVKASKKSNNLLYLVIKN